MLGRRTCADAAGPPNCARARERKIGRPATREAGETRTRKRGRTKQGWTEGQDIRNHNTKGEEDRASSK